MKTATLPKSTLLSYELNSETGHYHLQVAPIGFKKMPPVFKVEPTQERDRIKAKHLIRGRNGKWNDRILTGLMPFREQWYYGDHYERGKKSLIIFHFTPDKRRCIAFFHNNFYPFNPYSREELVHSVAENNSL